MARPLTALTEDEWIKGSIPSVMSFVYNLPSKECRWMMGRGRRQMLLNLGIAGLYWMYFSARTQELLDEMMRYEADEPGGSFIDIDELDLLMEQDFAKVNDPGRNREFGYLRDLFQWYWTDFADFQCPLEHWRPFIHDVFANPFCKSTMFDESWRTSTAVALAKQMYDARDFSAMPILADALQDTGCENEDILTHCRDATATHVRGCWVVDLVLGKT